MNYIFRITIKVVFALMLFGFIAKLPAQTPVINEFMSSNSATIADEDDDFEDWIEIYFDGEEMISLEGYGLSDDADVPFKWTFPEVKIQPGQYMLIWASGKDRRTPGSPLHTNFSIKSDGEELLLTHPSGAVVDMVLPVAVPTDISYGRQPDGWGEWYFFDEPTPGESNTTTGYSEILDPVAFSHNGAYYLDPFELELSHPDPDVTIIYTLDGSVPDPENLNGITYFYKNQYPEFPDDPFGEFLSGTYRSYQYTEPILIAERSNEPDKLTNIATTWMRNPNHFPSDPVFKGTVIRAIALKEGAIKSRAVTHSYFITNNNKTPYTLTTVSLSTNEDLMFEYESGVYVAGIDFDNWRLEHPIDTAHWQTPANYRRRGPEWEYPVHLEIFKNSESVFSQNMGYRIHGGWARSVPVKTFRLYARSVYGASTFDYPLFSEDNVEGYKRFLLRNSGQDYNRTLFRDAVIQHIVKHLNFDTQDYQPTILFINGEYWGIHNLRERYDKHYLARQYGVDPDNLDILSNHSIIVEGDRYHYYAMIDYISENDISLTEHYDYINTQMDVINFVDYQISQIFFSNIDWPHANVDFWRLRTDNYEPNSDYGHDGRWRWLMYDMDASLGLWSNVSSNSIEWATRPELGWHTFLLRNLMLNDTFEVYFISRFADLLNTTLLSERTLYYINEFKSVIEPEISEHISRWNKPESVDKWLNEVDKIKNFAALRPDYQRQHIVDFFSLDGLYELELNVSNRWHGHIRVNTIEITGETPGISHNPYPWSGAYFKDVPVELEAIPHLGFTFSHWEGDVSGADPIITIMPQDDIYVVAHFVKDDTPMLIHYWLFDASLPNDTPLESLEATYSLADSGTLHFHSALEGYPFDPDHPNWRKASMERRNAPTPLNYRPEGNNGIAYENANMRGIQIKQPFKSGDNENTLIFELPTTDFSDIVFRFAALDEGAADMMLLDYSIAEDEPEWITEGLSVSEFPLTDNFQLYEFDFSLIEEVNDQPQFMVRLRFTGDDMQADEGRRVTFNNISLDGVLISGINLPPVVVGPVNLQKCIENDPPVVLDLNEVFMDPDNDLLTFTAHSERPEVADVLVNETMLEIYPEKRGDAVITITADDGYHEPVSYAFRVLIYPEAFSLAEHVYSFLEWSADEPELSFPEHMMFMQGNESDPGLYAPLDYPYFIPHDDYHEDDQLSVGFPYNNTRRTRINGLGEEGISFINTGRERDLGGLLLALDTRHMEGVRMSWLAGTVHQNERKYALRLQYRTNIHQPFNNVIINAQPVEYISGISGDEVMYEDLTLPHQLVGHEYLQLLWRYYHLEGASGARAELRLDDLIIKDITGIHLMKPEKVVVYNHNDQLFIRMPEISTGEVTVFDVSGRVVLTDRFNAALEHSMSLRSNRGVLIVRIVTNDQVFVKKMLAY